MCAGSHLANRELYTAFMRVFSAFHVLPPKDRADAPILNSLDCNDVKTSLTTEPKKFKIGFRARNLEQLENWIGESDDRTKDL